MSMTSFLRQDFQEGEAISGDQSCLLYTELQVKKNEISPFRCWYPG